MIFIGKTESGEDISVSIHHTGIFGQTGTGKTTLVKDMIRQAVGQGFFVVVFDSKVTHAEFEGMDMSETIPFYLQENTDPDVYRSLIEGARTRGRGSMEKYRGGFIELCEPPDEPKAKDYTEIERRLLAKLADKKAIKGTTRAMYSEIYHDHLNVKAMLAKHDFDDPPHIGIKYGIHRIYRVPVRELPNLNLQGLVVRSIVEWVLQSGYHKMVIVVDEAPNFVSQLQYNPAKSALQMVDSQGRSAEIFGWYTGQTLSGFDKSNMKNLIYWILGRQMEKNEVASVYETQTDKVLTRDAIKKLKTRDFIVSTPDWSKLVKVPDLSKSSLQKAQETYGSGVDQFGQEAPQVERVRHALGVATLAATAGGWRIEPEEVQKAVDKLAGNPIPLRDGLDGPTVGQATLSMEPRPDTKAIGTFTLQVTKLESDNMGAKVAYILKQNGKMMSASEIEREAVEYGWTLNRKSISQYAKSTEGAVVADPNGNGWRLARMVKVEEVTVAR